ncbi:hypothetical protein EVAR_76703_1 [Eumeta japonica]|uniref:Uncharacterized protein n=1 Tax=Eumeta variegata TaxID=151549 RepID=A0A4C1SSU7_EUMVA|nr:hypothetical protein EVAR_76703_1 [Eumeta japonica]
MLAQHFAAGADHWHAVRRKWTTRWHLIHTNSQYLQFPWQWPVIPQTAQPVVPFTVCKHAGRRSSRPSRHNAPSLHYFSALYLRYHNCPPWSAQTHALPPAQMVVTLTIDDVFVTTVTRVVSGSRAAPDQREELRQWAPGFEIRRLRWDGVIKI